MIDEIHLVVVTDPSIEVAVAKIDAEGVVSYGGVDDALISTVERELEGKPDRRAAFDALARKGWSNAYLMIALPQEAVA